jgi:arsenate reductase (thioredoxin)
MAEIGIGLSGEHPKPLTDAAAVAANVVTTIGCGDACPVYPGKRYLTWDLPDLAGKTLAEVRPIRDTIARLVRDLVAGLAGPSSRGDEVSSSG